MSEDGVAHAREAVDAAYRSESRRVLATLIRLLGDFDIAEEAMHQAFTAALEQWERDGVPENPRAWLVTTGRFKAIDRIRRRARFDGQANELAERLDAEARDAEQTEHEGLEDDRLRLIFTCCHPSLPPDAQMALTLREVCGLTTEEIARAFLTAPSTLAQRIVRAKNKIKVARIPYEVPGRGELPDRLDTVLRVVYLVFNEGYAASSGESLTRHDLSGEAIRLGRLLAELMPDETEVIGLLALMLLHESRRAARTSADGDIVLLDDQDRSVWDAHQIAEGTALVDRTLATRRIGPYTLQAAIAAAHARARTAAATDWAQIASLYDVLLRVDPVPRRRAEPRGGGRDARRSCGGAGAHRRDPRRWRPRRLPPGALGPRGALPPARPHRRGARVLRARARPDAPRARAPLPRAPPRRAGRLIAPRPFAFRP
jgi:RNA polymerase sigma-70 factor (ECF subfamily)